MSPPLWASVPVALTPPPCQEGLTTLFLLKNIILASGNGPLSSHPSLSPLLCPLISGPALSCSPGRGIISWWASSPLPGGQARSPGVAPGCQSISSGGTPVKSGLGLLDPGHMSLQLLPGTWDRGWKPGPSHLFFLSLEMAFLNLVLCCWVVTGIQCWGKA